MNTNQKFIGSFALSIAMVLACVGGAEANPSNRSPYKPLTVIGTIQGAKDEADRLYKLFAAQAKILVEADRLKSKPQDLPAASLVKLYGDAWIAERDADRLAQMGEPAGEDLRIRFQVIQEKANQLCRMHTRTPQGKQLGIAAVTKMRNNQPSLERFLSQADKAITAGKLEAVEKQMQTRGVNLRQSLAYLTPDQQTPFWKQYGLTLKRCDVRLVRVRRAKYLKIVEAASKQDIDQANLFLDDAKRIRTEIQNNGVAKLGNGELGDAVDAFAYLSERWGHTSAALNRAIALRWAFTNRPKIEIKPTPRRLYFDIQPILVELADAAADSVDPGDVSTLYQRLLKQIAQTDRRCNPKAQFSDKFKAPLARLAKQDRRLDRSIESYELATKQPLRWRSEFVLQQVDELSQGYKSTRKLFYSKLPASAEQRPFFSPQSHTPGVAAANTLIAPASVLVQESTPALVGAQVSGGPLIRISPTSRTSLVPLQIQGYMSSPVPKATAEQLSDMRRALLVTKTHGPLTIEAANALSSTELNDYLSVGGVVQDIHLESLVTRFATLPDAAYVMAALGDAPNLTTVTFPREQICWRLNINPKWAHNGYLVVRPGSE